MGEATAEQPSVAFGMRVRHARLAMPGKPNQGKVGKQCGWDQAKQSRIENGAMLSADDLAVLADVLDVDPYYLFTGKHAQPVSTLAATIDRMELDHWGEDAILAVARQEERRVKTQRGQQDDELVKRLIALGVDPQTIDEALRPQDAPEPGSGQSPQGARRGQEDRQAQA